MKAIQLLLGQLGKNIEKQPGWAYLLIAVYVILQYWSLPDELVVLGFRAALPSLSTEIWALCIALPAYLIGDAIDKPIFNRRDATGKLERRFKPTWVEDPKKLAQDALGVGSGIYGVALGMHLEVKEGSLGVTLLNELAKALRGLAVIAAAVASYSALNGYPIRILFGIGVVVSATFLYVVFKLWHLRSLYRWASGLKDDNFRSFQLDRFRVVTWKWKLVATGEFRPQSREAAALNEKQLAPAGAL